MLDFSPWSVVKLSLLGFSMEKSCFYWKTQLPWLRTSQQFWGGSWVLCLTPCPIPVSHPRVPQSLGAFSARAPLSVPLLRFGGVKRPERVRGMPREKLRGPGPAGGGLGAQGAWGSDRQLERQGRRDGANSSTLLGCILPYNPRGGLSTFITRVLCSSSRVTSGWRRGWTQGAGYGLDIPRGSHSFPEDEVVSMADSTTTIDDIEGELFRIERIREILVRRESELRYMMDDIQLCKEISRLKTELQKLLSLPENQKSNEEKQREEELVQQIHKLVETRDFLVDDVEFERLREREEDKEMAEFLQSKLSKSYLQRAAPVREKKMTSRGQQTSTPYVTKTGLTLLKECCGFTCSIM
ncbi:PREDICTED: LOW QUALITY PROTEIN: uncharacterized protein LOC103613792 [Corvus brachyrhynchos]|uniref:LOW QUALITY PROTEIN: uncharacterized protein LOC103613792 n=1 Tax=Corvus brachyrhynchos TaxID=85066 RepID=UPI0008166222|nr:PREDICTED: LOW QUALITY PROTEIN: uncharacterized protein LOC103613792 [Corvus brachyrhynchos]